MIDRLIVQHYQSIDNAVLDLAPVSLIVGRNFSGKTALLRALRALATNQTGDEFIQEGKKDVHVDVLLEDGREIGWLKQRGKGAEYDLDGTPFTKTAGQVPDEVRDVLGIREIEVDSTLSLLPQLQGQWDGPFLVGESGSRIARVLGRLTKLDIIVTAQMSCKKERDRHRREGENASEEHDRLLEQRDAMPDVAGLRQDIDLISGSLTRALEAKETLEQARYLAERLRVARRIKDIDLSPLRDGLERATALLEAVRPIRSLSAALLVARSSLSSATEGVNRQQKALAAAQEQYEAECARLGLCDHCPLKEAS